MGATKRKRQEPLHAIEDPGENQVGSKVKKQKVLRASRGKPPPPPAKHAILSDITNTKARTKATKKERQSRLGGIQIRGVSLGSTFVFPLPKHLSIFRMRALCMYNMDACLLRYM